MATSTPCRACESAFTVTEDDRAFHRIVSPVVGGKTYEIPPPTLCPDCRLQRRLAWRNERNLYRRKSDTSGKPILSVFSAEKPLKVYDTEEWYAESWDPMSYGRSFDFNRPFFEQFSELMHDVPQLSRSIVQNQNCDYVNQCGWCKNCYLIFEADFDENCLYGNNIYESRSCVDNLQITNCELCYECTFCTDCYNLRFSQQCENCADSSFLRNCVGCHDCIGCVNLRNKKYCIFNEQCTREEYQATLQSLKLHTRSGIQNMQDRFTSFALQFPHKYLYGAQNEDSTGNYLWNTQRCTSCFETQHAQDCKYVANSRNMKNVHDTTVYGSRRGAELSYENHEIGDGVQMILFSDQIWTAVSNVYYSKLCLNNSHDLFGCVGLRHASHCVLNKQYTKEEYEALISRIIDHMRQTGEWGEFFPIAISPFAYNETLAQEHFPLTKEETLAKGWAWREQIDEVAKVSKVIPGASLPDAIDSVPDDILEWALKCEATNRPFRIVKQELDFYRQQYLPIPTFHPDERHRRRTLYRTPRKLWDRQCVKCGKAIRTTYAPERPEIVYCEECYQQAVV